MKYYKLLLLLFMSFSLWAQESDLIPIQSVAYPRNNKASFCRRPLEMLDTIVFHHSETPPTQTPLQINQLHLNRGTPQDPWYMVAYSFQVHAPYVGTNAPVPNVFEGRPLDLVGAHAGSKVFVPMDIDQKRLWDEGQILCGKEGEEFKLDPKQLNDIGNIKANVTTLGIVVIGNYAPFGRDNPNGYRPSKVRNPTSQLQDNLARISCQLQKKNPRIKYLRWHNYYHSTTCPGNIKNFVPQIRALAKGYGCEFK
jgi:hypothetical protein